MASDADEVAVTAAAADILCSLRFADQGGFPPPWRKPAQQEEGEARELIWPVVARGKRSRRRSPAAAAKGRWARASPASPLDYSGGSGSGSGASTSGGEDGGFFSPPAATAAAHRHVGPAPAAKAGPTGRPSIVPALPPRPVGQRPRKKMRLPEIQQLVRSLTVENESLREEMQTLQRACTALSKENCKLETRLEQSSMVRNGIASKEQKGKQQLDEHSAVQSPQDSFVLPDLNLPAQDVTD